jgi:hypothetical protein
MDIGEATEGGLFCQVEKPVRGGSITSAGAGPAGLQEVF